MENTINVTPTTHPYLRQFTIAQANLNQLIEEERIHKLLQKSKRQLLSPR